MKTKRILIVDDEAGIRESLRDILEDEHYRVELAENATAANVVRPVFNPDLILLDIWMPDCDGITLLKDWARTELLTTPVVMMSGHGTIDTALEAIRMGAFDFLEKPIALQKLLKTVQAALQYSERNRRFNYALVKLGKSPAMLALSERLAGLTTRVALLIGPVGCAAEHCARLLRAHDKPWLKLDHKNLLAERPLEILKTVRGGTLYVSEVAELKKFEQRGLLLAIHNAEKYDVRVVCSTSSKLSTLQKQDLFDSDLCQTLLSVVLRVPALSEHPEDIPEIVLGLANWVFEQDSLPYREIDVAALNAWRNASWPGDMVALEAATKNLVYTSLGDRITLEDAMRVLQEFNQTQQENDATASVLAGIELNRPLREVREDFERLYFNYLLTNTKGAMNIIADKAGLERTHIYRKLKYLGIKPNNKA